MPYTITSMIICDDVRQETSGKQTLVGVYAGELIVRSFPVKFHQLCFRLGLRLDGSKHHTATLLVKSRGGKVVLNATTEANIKEGDLNAVFVFGLRGAHFEEADDYEIEFALDGLKTVAGEFVVRLPKTESESSRLS